MVKINAKYFDKIANEPVQVQTIKDKNVSIHFLNDTPYYNEFISKGRFFFWSTKGQDYKLVMEEGYYEEIKDLFNAEVNEIWINYYEESEKVRMKSFKKFLLPALLIYALVSFAILMWLPNFAIPGLLVAVALMFIGSRFFSNYLNKEFSLKNNEAIAKIKKIIGKKEYEALMKKSDKYRNKFYQFEEEAEETEDENDEKAENTEVKTEVIEDKKEVIEEQNPIKEESTEAIEVVEHKEEV